MSRNDAYNEAAQDLEDIARGLLKDYKASFDACMRAAELLRSTSAEREVEFDDGGHCNIHGKFQCEACKAAKFAPVSAPNGGSAKVPDHIVALANAWKDDTSDFGAAMVASVLARELLRIAAPSNGKEEKR